MSVDDLSRLGLADLARLADATRRPPVERWDPPHCGDSSMRIARDGSWHHEGRPIRRPEMVRLFASILRREPDGGYVVVVLSNFDPPAAGQVSAFILARLPQVMAGADAAR